LYEVTQLRTYGDGILEELCEFSKTQWFKNCFHNLKLGRNEKNHLEIANQNQPNGGGYKGYKHTSNEKNIVYFVFFHLLFR